jgi:hypothetical protein
MRLRLPLVAGTLALALGVSACIDGGPRAGGTPAQTISANVHNNTRLAPGSCGNPATPPDDVESWVGSATGLVRGLVTGLEEGPQSPGLATLRIDMVVIAVAGDTVADVGSTIHGTITIWNLPGEADGWNAWGKPLTYEQFDDTMEAILPVIGQFGDFVGGRLCYPIVFGTPTAGAFLSGTPWGTLDQVEDDATAAVLAH